MQSRTNNTSIFKTLLHTADLKATPSRLAVLNILAKKQKPLSIQEITTELDDLTTDQATLYRMIKTFVEKNIITQVDLKHAHAHYELKTDNHHHHLICKNCGKTADIEACPIPLPTKQTLKKHGFASINDHSLEFFGLCNKCNQK